MRIDRVPLASRARKSTVAPANGRFVDLVTVPTTESGGESFTGGSALDAPGARSSRATIVRGRPEPTGGTISTRYWPASPTMVNDPVASVAVVEAARPATRRSENRIA